MELDPHSWPLPVLAVLGPSTARPDEEEAARRIGAAAAAAGWVVLTGGGAGVMAAAARGAAEAGGLTVGVLPVAAPGDGYPDPWIAIAVYTGSGSARNAFNVLSAQLCVAVGGGPGTLSELALAAKAGVETWSWRSWETVPPPGVAPLPIRRFETVDQLVAALDPRLRRDR